MADSERHWSAPKGFDAAVGSAVPLPQIYNSLKDSKQSLVPVGGPASKQLTWYECGPTVYDSAHMGHARNYVTFDIVRRILEEYFGYSILYVMNVTDVDDKIIRRAKRNHLLQQYQMQHPDPVQVHFAENASQPWSPLTNDTMSNACGLQVLTEVHSALSDSIAAQRHKLAETTSGAQSARNDAKLARSNVG